jgi:hypothetical protein
MREGRRTPIRSPSPAACVPTGWSTTRTPTAAAWFPLGVTTATFQSAQNSCRHLLPNGGNGPDQAELQQVAAQGLRFARCMRTHGIALPDPDSSGRIPDPASEGINQGSPQFEAANHACGKYRPPYMPSNAQYNAYAQAQGS